MHELYHHLLDNPEARYVVFAFASILMVGFFVYFAINRAYHDAHIDPKPMATPKRK